jgi:DMSO/TMAO reductase YedYZ molybdopterin-dependent catalytic subunit
MSKKNNTLIKTLRYLSLLTVLTLGFITIVATGGGEDGSDTSKDLGAGELREYQGQQLSSINDFHENSIHGPQHIDQGTYELKITGLVENPTTYSYDEVVNNFTHYTKVVPLHCVEGWTVNILWEGMLVRDVIQAAGPLSSAKIIIFHAYDGDTTSFPIDYVMNYDIIMAYKMNGLTIPAERGFPFQLVAEDKWGYKWAKWITEIELSDNINYLGYWESNGYSNSGWLYNCAPGPISAQPTGHTTRTDCCTCHSAN